MKAEIPGCYKYDAVAFYSEAIYGMSGCSKHELVILPQLKRNWSLRLQRTVVCAVVFWRLHMKFDRGVSTASTWFSGLEAFHGLLWSQDRS